MTNRFTKTSFFVQGGIMRPPSDGGLKSRAGTLNINFLAIFVSKFIKYKIIVLTFYFFLYFLDFIYFNVE